MKKVLIAAACASTLAYSAASTALPPPVADSVTKTTGYVGLNWTWGGSLTPSLVLGAFNTRVKSNNDTEGANLTVYVDFIGGLKFSKVKLGYLNGRNDLQGEIAGGYDFIKSAPLLGLGVNGPYLNLGVDAYSWGNFVPYLNIHSKGKFDEPTATAQLF